MRFARTLSGYIAAQFLGWCGGVFGAMLVIIFLLDYVELLRRGAAKPEATLGRLLEMAALKLPHMAQEVLPFAVLFGTMMAFWRLTRSNELVVARAAGVSAWQFLTPAVVSALLIGVVSVTVFNPIASAMQAGYEGLEQRILRGSDSQFAVFRSGLWLREADDGGNLRVIHADRVSGKGVALDNATIYFFRGFDQFVGRIDAARAKLEAGHWQVSGGWSWEQGGGSTAFDELAVPTGFTPGKIRESFASPETMSFWKLPGFIHLLEDSGFSAQRHRLYFNGLLARPFLLCAMVLIAATFSLRMQRRGGATMMIAAGVATGFLLYFLSDVVFAFGLSATIPVALAAWTPAGVCLLLGASLLLHLEDG
jgi:lipopolysaccharide export system permease protein